MIEAFPSRINFQEGSPYLKLTSAAMRSLRLQNGVKLRVCLDAKYNNIYISLVHPDSALRNVTILVKDSPGVIADISCSIGKENVNIIEATYFTASGAGIGELVIEHTTPVQEDKALKEWQTIRQKLFGRKYRREIYDQPIYLVMPFLRTTRLCEDSAELDHNRLRLPANLFEQMGLKEKEYLVLVTVYLRFFMLVVRVFEDPEKVVFARAGIAHEPNVLGPICKSIRKTVNILYLGQDHTRAGEVNGEGLQEKAKLSMFCELLKKKSCNELKTELSGLNKKRHLIDIETIECLKIEDYEKSYANGYSGRE